MLVENLGEDEENNIVERLSVKDRRHMEYLDEDNCRNNDVGNTEITPYFLLEGK